MHAAEMPVVEMMVVKSSVEEGTPRRTSMVEMMTLKTSAEGKMMVETSTEEFVMVRNVVCGRGCCRK